MGRLSAIVVLSTLLGLTACGNPDDRALEGPSQARLSAPLDAPTGVPVLLDASASFDPESAVREYTFSFSDGSPPVTSATPQITHVFQDEGAFEVAVIFKDHAGLLTRATQLVLVRADARTCQAVSDCSLGAECRAQLCYVTSVGFGSGLADCKDDSECGSGAKCRAGLCLSSSPTN